LAARLDGGYDPLWLEVKRFFGIRSAKLPKASKDGRLVAFLSDVTGVDVPWVWDGERVDLLLPLEDRVGGVELGPGGLVALARDVNGNERWILDVYDASRGELLRVHGDGRTIVSMLGAWDADGSKLAFTSNARNGVDFDLYVYVRGRGARLAARLEGMNRAAAWLDGRRVLVVHSNTNMDSDIYLVDTESGAVENLTEHRGEARNLKPVPLDEGRFLFLTNAGQEFTNVALYDLEKRGWRYVYRVEREVEDLDASPDGSRVVFTENHDGFSRLYIADAGFREVQLVDSPEGVVGSVSWGAAGVFYDVSGPRVGHDVFAVKPGEEPRRLTRSPSYGIRMEENVAPEVARYESWDGMLIPVLMYRPRRGRPPYPAVVILHGGPESQARPKFDPLVQVLVRLGYLVMMPNFRGSTGYGKTFVHLDDRERRIDSLRDIGALVDWAEQQGLVVKGRVAVTGASYGGYATLMSLALFPNHWSCGVERVGIVNLITFIRNTGAWRRRYRLHEYGDPDTMADVMLELSPITHLERIKVPLMVVHGSNDPRVPVSEAEQLVARMRELGKEVVFLRLDDEGHGLAKVRNRTTIYTEIVKFIVKHTPPQVEP
jgi:dipeptidyl aminopeptidase/acylaminoacyl peptidase